MDTVVNAIAWLLESEPPIRWQALRDLTDASPAAVSLSTTMFMKFCLEVRAYYLTDVISAGV